jgi:hypothetical protein
MMVVAMMMVVVRMMVRSLPFGGKGTDAGGCEQRDQDGNHNAFHDVSPICLIWMLLFP